MKNCFDEFLDAHTKDKDLHGLFGDLCIITNNAHILHIQNKYDLFHSLIYRWDKKYKSKIDFCDYFAIAISTREDFCYCGKEYNSYHMSKIVGDVMNGSMTVEEVLNKIKELCGFVEFTNEEKELLQKCLNAHYLQRYKYNKNGETVI